MKKILCAILFCLFLVGCVSPNKPPTTSKEYYIGFTDEYKELNILVGENINLAIGVIAYHLDDLTTEYVIDDSEVDYNKVGSYNIYYRLGDVVTSRKLNITGYRVPVLRYSGNPITYLELNQKSYNLYDGLTAFDADDGDLTSNITMEDNNFDITVEGEYLIDFYVLDSHNNKSNVITKTIMVSYSILSEFPVWTNAVPNEAAKPTTYKCFAGDWSYTVKTAYDYYFGIEVTLTLPSVDINRYNDFYDTSLDVDPNVRNLDNPSIYLGGTAWNESDVGINLSLVSFDGTTLSKGSYAWRPFWRYITYKDYDLGSYADHDGKYGVVPTADYGSSKNLWANWNDFETRFYYLPGDKIRMICFSPEADFLQLQIEVLEVSKDPSSIAIREKYNWDEPDNFLSPKFSSPEHGTNRGVVFKRVNAIDQVANEGKPSTETTTLVRETLFESAYLYRTINGTNYRIPMNNNRVITYACPKIEAFIVSSIDNLTGKQTVTIKPEGVTNP